MGYLRYPVLFTMALFNDKKQVLIKAGSCSSGEIKYSLDNISFTSDINEIKGKKVGKYTVYYKVEENENFEESKVGEVKAQITEKETPAPNPDPGGTKPSPNPDSDGTKLSPNPGADEAIAKEDDYTSDGLFLFARLIFCYP